MREAIETVPSDGKFVILEDDSSGSYAVARWSAEAGDWIGEKGEPIKITPTHWHPMPGSQSHPQEDNESGALSLLGPAPSRRRRFGFLPFSARRAAPRKPQASHATRPAADAQQAGAIETPTVTVKSKRAPRARRHLVALSLAIVVVAALVATSFRTDVVAYLKPYAGQLDIVWTGTPDVPATSYAVQAADSTTVELRESLQQERGKAETLTQSLATAQREIAKHIGLATRANDEAAQVKRAAETTTAELRQSLQQERAKAEALAQSLATAQREIDKHTALASKAADDAAMSKRAAESTAAELRQSLQQEHDRAEALAQDLVTARREIDARTALASKVGNDAVAIKRAAESTAAELRQSLQQERDRTAALAKDLATARREIDMLAVTGKADDDATKNKQALERTTVELRQALQQERDRAEALAQTLATAHHDIDKYAALASKASDEAMQIKRTAESTTAELRESLEHERDRADALASKSDDDAAQMKRAADTAIADLRQSLQQERDRAETLAQSLARARREIDMFAVLAGKASDDAAAQLKAAESTTAELQQSLQQERDRAEALARDLDSTRSPAAPRNAPEPTTIAQVSQVMATAAVEQPAAPSQDGPDVARLLARAGALLNDGNIGAARIVLEHATATGSARASFALAETYDPLVLSTWGTYGTRGDPTRARELYAKAHAGGIRNAQERLNALQQ